MNIQVLVSSARGPKTIDLSETRSRLIISSVLLAIILVLFSAGFLAASYLAPTGTVNTPDEWYASLLNERDDIQKISEQATNDINALALSLGRMEARSIRLDALGSRLASLAGLGEEEFDFTGTPAVGGPEDDLGAVSSQLPELLERFTDLQLQIDDRRNKLMLLESILMDRELREQVMPTGRPVVKGWMSSHFGKRTDPFTGKSSWHAGVDFAGKHGSDIVSVASGIVTLAKDNHGFGKVVEISHGNGFLTRYAHNSKLLVKVGERVEKGQVIAKMGSTGRSTGPHVHFEVVKDGKVVNPRKYIFKSARK